MFENGKLKPEELARQIMEERKREAEEWMNEQISIIDEATNENKEKIKQESDALYQAKHSEILHSIFGQFSDLMKKNDTIISQYVKRTPELLQSFNYLTENLDRNKNKLPRSTSASKNQNQDTIFDEDFKEIINICRESGQYIDNMTIFSDGTLFYNGEFYQTNDKISIQNRFNENIPGIINLITQYELLIQQGEEQLIVTMDDLTSNRYRISH